MDFVIQMQFVYCEVKSAILCILQLNYTSNCKSSVSIQAYLHLQIITYAVSESTVLCVANRYETLTMHGLLSVLILKTVFLLFPHRAGQTFPIEGPNPTEQRVTSCGKKEGLYICVRFISQNSQHLRTCSRSDRIFR